MNPLAEELNRNLEKNQPVILSMLSEMGKNLFFPKGILSQSAEAKQKAHKLNATIGIATEGKGIMHFSSIMNQMNDLKPEETLTYAPSFGIPALRKAWQQAIVEKNPSLSGRAISLPVVTCGITHALSIFGDVWVNPGDTILLPDMMWGNYNMIYSVRRGARIASYRLFSPEGGFNLAAFEACLRQEAEKRDKIIVLLNFPQNPSGYTVTKTEGARIADILTETAARGTKVIVVLDDAYFGLFYEEETMKESLFSLLSDRHANLLAVKLDGATKENFVWGLRVGFITYGCRIEGDAALVYEALERKTAGAIRGNISNASHLGQTLTLKSMQSETYRQEKAAKFAILKKRANRVKAVLADPKYRDAWDVYPFNSGYFMCIRLKAVDAETLRRHLLERYGVGLIALGERNLRVAFSCLEENEIQELFDIVLQGVTDLA
ncbi:MAG: aminotransferase class I/II-fold pyridoxal phosphate-dependent enzyme [Thermodesulfobacteriota bacterium]